MEKLKDVGNSTTCPVVAIVRDGRLLVGLRHYTQDKQKVTSVWTIPGGRCDGGETIEETLRRETFEEVGITRLNIVSYLGEVAGAKAGDTVHVFAGATDQEPVLREPEKFSEWRWEKVDRISESFINRAALELIENFVKGN